MFNVKPILKESLTAESCNAVQYLRGMPLYDFMISCAPYCWKGNVITSAPPLPGPVLSLCFTSSKLILITGFYMLGEFSAF